MRSERAPPLSLPGTGRGDRAQRGGWGFLQPGQNGREDAVKIVVNLGVPEAQNPESEFSKPRIARRIGGRMPVESVLAAVDFDDQMMPQASEVDDECAKWSLPPKMIAAFAPAPQVSPELHLLGVIPFLRRRAIWLAKSQLRRPHPPCFAWSPLPVPGRDGGMLGHATLLHAQPARR